MDEVLPSTAQGLVPLEVHFKEIRQTLALRLPLQLVQRHRVRHKLQHPRVLTQHDNLIGPYHRIDPSLRHDLLHLGD